MLILLLLACSTGTITVPTDDRPLPVQDDTALECGPGTHAEDGLCVPDDDTAIPVDTDTGGPVETGDDTATEDTAMPDDTGVADDTAVVPTIACSDGTEEVRLESVAFCAVPTMTLSEFSDPRSGQVFAEECADGWSVCDDASWRAGNGGCSADFSFGALLDQPGTGDNVGVNSCVVAHNPSTGAECSSDYTGYEEIGVGNGTCEVLLPPDGIDIGELYGLVGRNSGATSGGFGQLGIACCLDE